MLKFMVVAVTAYGMATLEGPTLAIKSVNSISHYTDWTIAHVHTARSAGTVFSRSACCIGFSRSSTTRNSGPPNWPITISGSRCWG